MRRIFLALGLLAAAAPAAAQDLADYDYENLAFRGVGVDAGLMWATKVRDTETFGLRFDLGYLGPGVRIIPSIGYWRSRLEGKELEALATRLNEATGVFMQPEDLGPIRWSDVSLSLDGHFVWNTPLHALAFLGAGIGLHALNGQGDAIDGTIVEDLFDSITAAFALIGGLEIEPVDRFRLYGEGRLTAMNAIQYLSVRAGLQFMFQSGDASRVGGAVPAPRLAGEGR